MQHIHYTAFTGKNQNSSWNFFLKASPENSALPWGDPVHTQQHPQPEPCRHDVQGTGLPSEAKVRDLLKFIKGRRKLLATQF